MKVGRFLRFNLEAVLDSQKKMRVPLDCYKHYAYTCFMTARDFKKMRLKKGYSQSQLARDLDVHVLTVSKWERQVVPIPRMAELALISLKARLKTKKRG